MEVALKRFPMIVGAAVLVFSLIAAASPHEAWRSDYLRNLAEAEFGKGAHVYAIFTYEGYSNGGTDDINPSAYAKAQRDYDSCQAGIEFMVVGATNPLHYDKDFGGHNYKVNEALNATLRKARAESFHRHLKRKARIAAGGIANDIKGVHLVAVIPPEPQPTIKVRERVVVREGNSLLPDGLRLATGLTVAQCDRIDAGLPIASLTASWTLDRKTSVGLYATSGLNFGEPVDRTGHAGAEFYRQSVFLRGGYRTGAVEIPGDGHSLARFEGPELGAGFRRGLFELGLYVAHGSYADVENRDERGRTMFAGELLLTIPVR
jgi:hypothetical protein